MIQEVGAIVHYLPPYSPNFNPIEEAFSKWFQQKLLAEKDLTFRKAFELAQAIEAAEKNSKDLYAAKPTSETVHAVQKKSKQRKRTTQQSTAKHRNECYRCGGSSHKANLKMQIATIAKRKDTLLEFVAVDSGNRKQNKHIS